MLWLLKWADALLKGLSTSMFEVWLSWQRGERDAFEGCDLFLSLICLRKGNMRAWREL